MWKTNITDTIGPEFGDDWKKYQDQAYAHYGNAGGLQKNPLAVARTLEYAWNSNLRSTILQELVNSLLAPKTTEADRPTQQTAHVLAESNY